MTSLLVKLCLYLKCMLMIEFHARLGLNIFLTRSPWLKIAVSSMLNLKLEIIVAFCLNYCQVDTFSCHSGACSVWSGGLKLHHQLNLLQQKRKFFQVNIIFAYVYDILKIRK